jgi:hypothetical protein
MRLRIVCAVAALAATLAGSAPAGARSVVARAARPATVVLLAANAWKGTNPESKQRVYDHVGAALERAGHRVVVTDYPAGVEAGLTAVRAAVRAELTARPDMPLCLYGESSGGHLALLAAEDVRIVDCVITLAAPVDLHRWEQEATDTPETKQAQVFRQLVEPALGADVARWAAFDPFLRARRLPRLLLTMAEADDVVIPRTQFRRLPGRHYLLPSGAVPFLHGTTSSAGRAEMTRRVLGLVARAGISGRRR